MPRARTPSGLADSGNGRAVINWVERVLMRISFVVVAVAVVAIAVALIPGGQTKFADFLDSMQNRGAVPDISGAEQALGTGDKSRALKIAAQVVAQSSADAD